ncbi:hypothetical protein ABZ920_08320 [Streptomyces sp. NPDC046831]|uniref:hypothetical protein n=1 Tax=Streptomyces sp. NPDC046831 TaxID=3154805 RepID=UPI0033D09F2F
MDGRGPPGGDPGETGGDPGETGGDPGETGGDSGETGGECGDTEGGAGGEEPCPGSGAPEDFVSLPEGFADPDVGFPGSPDGASVPAPGADAWPSSFTRMAAEGGSVSMTRSTVLAPATVGLDTISISQDSPGLSVRPAQVPSRAENCDGRAEAAERWAGAPAAPSAVRTLRTFTGCFSLLVTRTRPVAEDPTFTVGTLMRELSPVWTSPYSLPGSGSFRAWHPAAPHTARATTEAPHTTRRTAPRMITPVPIRVQDSRNLAHRGCPPS